MLVAGCWRLATRCLPTVYESFCFANGLCRLVPFRIGCLASTQNRESCIHFCQPPIHHKHLAVVADHDVIRLEVAVDDAFGMSKGHGVAGLEEDVEEMGHRCAGLQAGVFCCVPLARLYSGLETRATIVGQNLAKTVSFYMLHREVEVALLIFAKVVDGDDVRMFELSGDLGFFQKTKSVFLRIGDADAHDFHGDASLKALVMAEHDFAHAALRDLFFGVQCFLCLAAKLQDGLQVIQG